MFRPRLKQHDITHENISGLYIDVLLVSVAQYLS